MKKIISLLLATILMLSCGSMAVFAQDEVWEWETPPYNDTDKPYAVMRIPNNVDYGELNNTNWTYVLNSPEKVGSITFANNYLRAEIKSTAESSTGWRTTFQLIPISPKGAFSKEETGTVYEDTCTIKLTDEQTISFLCKTTIVASPFISDIILTDLDNGNQNVAWKKIPKGHRIQVEVKYIYKDDPNFAPAFTWDILSGSEFATFEGDLTTVETPESTTTIVLVGKGAGDFRMGVHAPDPTETFSVFGNTKDYKIVNKDGYAPIEVPDKVKDDLAAGTGVEIDVPVNSGLSADNLADLKTAAKETGAKVTLKHNSEDNLELTFDPSAIKDDWEGTFSPAFTPAAPESAIDKGFSQEGGKWIQFSYSGALPAPMTVTMKVDSFAETDTEYKVWYYNNNDVLVEQQVDVVYNAENRTITFTLDHFSTYAVFPASINPNDGIATNPSPSQGSGNSGNSNSAKPVATTTAKTVVGVSQAKKAADAAIKQAVTNGKSAADIRFVNPAAFSKAALDAIIKACAESKVQPIIHADTVEKGKIISRLYIDPTAATLLTDLNPTIHLSNPTVEKRFVKYFNNELIKVIEFGQKGSFGMPVDAAVKLDLGVTDTSKLHFYTYDAGTNQYDVMSKPQSVLDVNGFLHFTTTEGDFVIVTEHPLTLK